MKIGINLLLWTCSVNSEHYHLFPKTKAAGYDGVEIPISEPDLKQHMEVAKALNDCGLEATTSTALPGPEHNPCSDDASKRQNAIDFLKKVLDCSHELNATRLIGPVYQPLGIFTGKEASESERENACESLRIVADHASQSGLDLILEYLNRYECYLLNTLADTASFIKRMDCPNVYAMMDTYHANIEELKPVETLGEHFDIVKHIHISENNRGIPGSGHAPIKETLKKLQELNYNHWLIIEAFGRELPELAAATCIWRDISPDPMKVVTEGYRYIKDCLSVQ